MVHRQGAPRARPDSNATSYWPAVACALACAAVALASSRFDWKLDDSYITFSYAQNWVQGHGIVFNRGEYVEGYTCFLWVALSALGLRLGADIAPWSTVLGILGAIGTVVVTWRFARELATEHVANGSVIAALVVAGYPCLWWWASSGMETTLFTFLITTAMWCHVRGGADSLAAPLCLALASMTLPEAWLLSGILCLDAMRIGSRRSAARYVAVFLGLFGPYYGWRFWYYGDPLPNTFYAKVGGTSQQVSRGVAYLTDFALHGGGALLILGAAAIPRITRKRVAAPYVFVVAYLAYVTLVGGDIFFFYRFFLPIVPLLAILSTVAILRFVRAGQRYPFLRWSAVLVLLTAYGVNSVHLQNRQMAYLNEQRWRNANNRPCAPSFLPTPLQPTR